MPEIKCKTCDKVFHISPSRIKKRKFCSKECYNEWVKNNPINYWEGKHRSDKDKKIMSEARLNSLRVPRKQNHWNWKGGKTKIYKHTDTQTFRYRQWRTEVFTRDNFTCQICGKVGGYLQPHHIKSWTKYPKLRYEILTGITVCKECHNLFRKILHQ